MTDKDTLDAERAVSRADRIEEILFEYKTNEIGRSYLGTRNGQPNMVFDRRGSDANRKPQVLRRMPLENWKLSEIDVAFPVESNLSFGLAMLAAERSLSPIEAKAVIGLDSGLVFELCVAIAPLSPQDIDELIDTANAIAARRRRQMRICEQTST